MSVKGEVMSPGEQSVAFARELGRASVDFRHKSLVELEEELFRLEARWMAILPEHEAREVRRRIAEEILMGAYVRNVEWPQFSRAFDQVRSLGYSSVERQVHVACLFARWAHGRSEHQEDARKILEQAEAQIAQGAVADSEGRELRESLEKTRVDTGHR